MSSELNPTPDGVAVEPELRPDLNGLLIRVRDGAPLYLIDQGYRRLIPNDATYKNLFRTDAKTSVDHNLIQITLGNPIADGAVLAHRPGWMDYYTWLIDYDPKPPTEGTKPEVVNRHIGSNKEQPPEFDSVYNIYQFLPIQEAQQVAPILMSGRPMGLPVVGPT